MEIVPACTNAKLKAVIRCKLDLEIEIHPYGLLRYDGVNDTGCDKHYCVLITVIEFTGGYHVIYVINCFWFYVGRWFTKFNGVSKINFCLHLKKIGIQV